MQLTQWNGNTGAAEADKVAGQVAGAPPQRADGGSGEAGAVPTGDVRRYLRRESAGRCV
jgi:hypothetical protein